MTWFLYALFAPAIWSVTTHLDKYLVKRYFYKGGIGALVLFSSLIGFILVPIFFFVDPDVLNIELWQAGILVASGVVYVASLIPLISALFKDEVSTILPMYQTVVVFSYIFGVVFLGEQLTVLQILASLVIVMGSVGLSLELDKKIRFKSEIFGLMLLASFMVALNSFIFKYVALQTNFFISSFWEYMGFVLMFILLMLSQPAWRNEFTAVLNHNKVPLIGMNSLNEILNICAKIVFNLATLLGPLSLIWVANSFQPAFTFVYAVILSFIAPDIIKEDLSRKRLMQKVIFVLIMVVGTVMLLA